MLRKGGKVYVSRNDKPGIFLVDVHGGLQISGSLDVAELQTKGVLFVKRAVILTNLQMPLPPQTKVTPRVPAEPKRLLPKHKTVLAGSNEIRIVNPNSFDVYATLRQNGFGVDLHVSSSSTGSVFVPNGKHEIFFVYSDRSDELFQGEGFTVKDHGVKINLIQIVNENYPISKVRK